MQTQTLIREMIVMLIFICIAVTLSCIRFILKYRMSKKHEEESLGDRLQPLRPKIIEIAKHSLDNMINKSAVFYSARELEDKLIIDVLDEMTTEMNPKVVELVKDIDEDDLNSFILFTIQHEWTLSSKKARLISSENFDDNSEIKSEPPNKNTNIEKADITNDLYNIFNQE